MHGYLCGKSGADFMFTSGRDPATGKAAEATWEVQWFAGVTEGGCGEDSLSWGAFHFEVRAAPRRQVGLCDRIASAIVDKKHNLYLRLLSQYTNDVGAPDTTGGAVLRCTESTSPIAIAGCKGHSLAIECRLTCTKSGKPKLCLRMGANVVLAVYEKLENGGIRPTWEGRSVYGRVTAMGCEGAPACCCEQEMTSCEVATGAVLVRFPEADLPRKEL